MDNGDADRLSALGRLLREWRRARNVSQLQLAVAADISARHLSFVETGRAQPGRDIVLRLASALSLPLRDRNAALMAAGYAPLSAPAALAASESSAVMRAVDLILRQQEPFPAFVMGRLGHIQRTNRGAVRFLALFLGEAAVEAGGMNIFRLVLAPDQLRPHIANWPEVARVAVMRLRREVS